MDLIGKVEERTLTLQRVRHPLSLCAAGWMLGCGWIGCAVDLLSKFEAKQRSVTHPPLPRVTGLLLITKVVMPSTFAAVVPYLRLLVRQRL